MRTFIVTGATSGLGLAIAQRLAAQHRVILAVRDLEKGQKVAKDLGEHCEAMYLDLTSLDSVSHFCAEWHEPLAGLINNAGVQISDQTRVLQEYQVEETFLVNHLSGFMLTVGLLPFLSGGRVLFIVSGTHYANHPTAKRFGFEGEKFESIEQCALGLNHSGSEKRTGMNRYATSKFLNAVVTVELAKRIDPGETQFFCLDPGLMAGTGLARTAPRIQQWFWRKVLPLFTRLLPDTSTVERSAATAAWLADSMEVKAQSGEIFSFNRKKAKYVSERVYERALGRTVVNDSFGLIQRFTCDFYQTVSLSKAMS